MIKKKKVFVLYHKSCSSGDGFGAAWAAWKKFGSRAEYVGINHSDDLPRGIRGAEVYLVDITYPEPMMKKLLASASHVTALDHHESSRDVTKMAHTYVYDVKRSGATIAWSYFFPHKKIPMLLRYLEDGDNFCFRMPYTKEMFASLHSYDRTFPLWDRIARELDSAQGKKKHYERGTAILQYELQLIKKAVEDAYEVELLGHRVFASNTSVLRDYIGNSLAKKSKAGFSVVWRRGEDTIRVSLRSVGARDVAKIAARFGGGGHKHAAAFIFKGSQKFPWKDIKK